MLKISFKKFIIYLFTIYFLSSLLMYYEHIFIQRLNFDTVNRSYFFLLIRELLLVFFSFFSFFYTSSKKIKIFIFFSLIYLSFLVIYNLLKDDTNFFLLLSGIRLFIIYLSCLFIYEFALNNSKAISIFVNKFITIIFFLTVVIVVYQLLFFKQDSEIFFGIRTTGFFNLPNIFSIFMASLALYYQIISNNKKFNFFIFALLILSLTTGGRLGIIVIFILFFFPIIFSIKINKIIKISFLFIFFVLTYKLTSNSFISGRNILENSIFEDGRLHIWYEIFLSLFKMPLLDILFGNLGLGTISGQMYCENKIFNCYSFDTSWLEQPHNSFLVFFISYGILGGLFFLYPLIFILFQLYKINLLAFFCIFVVLFTFSAMEIHPIALILALCVGLIFSKYKIKFNS